MMEAVDFDRRLTGSTSQLGVGVDRDRVGQVGTAKGPDLVVVDVLKKGSAESDVDHLLATADAEHGQTAGAGLPEQRQLGLVELGVDLEDLFGHLLAVERRVDVPAARQEEPVDSAEGLAAGGEGDRLCAGRFNRPEVRLVVCRPLPRTRCDADPRPLDLVQATSSDSILASSSAVP